MTANAHATLIKTKFFLNKSQSDNTLDDRLADYLLSANEWFERGIRKMATTPYPVSDDTTAIASQYAAGLWEQTNSMDKSKTPANIRLAETELEKFMSAVPAAYKKPAVIVSDDPREKTNLLPTQSSIYAFENF